MNVFSQGWEKTYGSSSNHSPKDIILLPDGSMIIFDQNTGVPQYEQGLLRIDANGDSLWASYYNYGSASSTASSLVEVTGGYLTSGIPVTDPQKIQTRKFNSVGSLLWLKSLNWFNPLMSTNCLPSCSGSPSMTLAVGNNGFVHYGGFTPFSGTTKIILYRVDGNGDSLWSKMIDGGSENYLPKNAIAISDGFVFLVESQDTLNNSDILVIKTDLSGDTIWTKKFSGINTEMPKEIMQTLDGGFAIISSSDSFGSGDWNIYLIKTDSLGNLLWTKTYGDAGMDYMFQNFPSSEKQCMKQNTDGGFSILGGTDDPGGMSDLFLIRTDNSGDTLWTRIFGNNFNYYAVSVTQLSDGSFMVYGWFDEDNVNYFNDIVVIKVSANGDLKWEKHFGGNGYDSPVKLIETNYNGCVLLGTSSSFNANNYAETYVIKIDSLGNSWSNHINGKVFIDTNTNCLSDSAENPALLYQVKITPSPTGSGFYYTSLDASGYYHFNVDSGNYLVELIGTHPYLDISCPSSYSVNFTGVYDTVTHNFGSETTASCPLLSVSIGATSFIRPCLQNGYSVQYCNNGTAVALSAYVMIDLPDEFLPSSSTLPWSSITGNVYRFDLGNIQPGDCGSFIISGTIDCNALIGSAVCAEAHIYPDSICTPVSPLWDQSSIMVDGFCVGDSLAHFVIHNTGDPISGDMQGASQYEVYINNVLIGTYPFQLVGGDSLIINIPVCGETVMLQANQRPGHPGNSHPQAVVEGCGGMNCQPFDLGYITQVPFDDADSFIDEDCQIVITSYDPNDKSVIPSGTGINNSITIYDELEYTIRFQNTGNDTAFLVVIRDTLDLNTMDISTVQSGASSHAYSFRIYGPGILEWKFSAINLPDSNTNEVASHGFVKFNVKQKNGNAPGTFISNSGSIYFDYNIPVVTAPVIVMVDTVQSIMGNVETTVENDFIYAYPNPFNETITLTLNPKFRDNNVHIRIYNIMGEIVNDFLIDVPRNGINYKTTIDGRSLAGGVYIIQAQNGNEATVIKIIKSTGK